jgi:hypothetical protein
MRIVGKRKERAISLAASGELLLEGARFNDEIHRIPGGDITGMPKGVYRFKTHAEANQQQEAAIIAGMVELARRRVN